METNIIEATKFFLQCIGGLTLVAAVFGYILYKIFVIDFVKKEQKEEARKKSEPHFIDQLLEQ